MYGASAAESSESHSTAGSAESNSNKYSSNTDSFARVNISTKSAAREEYENKKAEYARQRKLANDLKKTEKEIADTEEKIEEIDAQLNDPANGTNAELLIELSTKKEEAEERLLELYEHLEELT